VPKTQAARWLTRADVCAALGLAWGELREFEQAVDWLNRALTSERGECSMRALEQQASFRVRLAVEQWRASKRQSAAKREAVRLDTVERIESALMDLDVLSRRAPTVERLNLLGSAYKRLALVESEDGKRLEALTNMAQHYHLALQRQRDAYAFTNWLAATLLTGQHGGQITLDPADVQQQMAEMQRELNRRLLDDPNFWDATSLADLSLSHLLLQSLNPPRTRAKVSAGEAAAPVLAAYRAAVGRASSPREKAALVDNLDFLRSLWMARDKVTLGILEQLQESLS
jgi:tetratricopeptide (TPR) repeat protein